MPAGAIAGLVCAATIVSLVVLARHNRAHGWRRSALEGSPDSLSALLELYDHVRNLESSPLRIVPLAQIPAAEDQTPSILSLHGVLNCHQGQGVNRSRDETLKSG